MAIIGDRAAAPATAPAATVSDSDSDHECPEKEPEFVIDIVDNLSQPLILPHHQPMQFMFHADERRQYWPGGLLPFRHRRPALLAAAAGKDREERLRDFMFGPQAALCWCTFSFVGLTIYLANTPDLRDQPGFDWNLFVTASSALVMLFSLLSLLLSYLGVYRWLH